MISHSNVEHFRSHGIPTMIFWLLWSSYVCRAKHLFPINNKMYIIPWRIICLDFLSYLRYISRKKYWFFSTDLIFYWLNVITRLFVTLRFCVFQVFTFLFAWLSPCRIWVEVMGWMICPCLLVQQGIALTKCAHGRVWHIPNSWTLGTAPQLAMMTQ